MRRRGIEVAIYEAAPELREIGAGVALGPNAMKVLRSLGLEDDVRAIAGRWEWAVTRNWKTGRAISKTSRDQQAALFGSAGATAHRADLLDVLSQSLPSDIVSLGARCTGVEPDGDVAVARFQDGSEIEADAIIGADGIHSVVRASLFGPDAPRFTGKICYRSVVPVDAVPGEPPPSENVQWLGPHGTIVAVPGAARRADQRRLPLRRRGVPARVLGVRVRAQRGARALQRLARVAAARSSRRERSGTSGRSTTGTRSRSGRGVASPCSAMPRIRCCRTWGRGRVRRSRTAACSRRRSPRSPMTRSRRLARYERSRRPRASQVVLASRARGVSNHLASPLAAFKRDVSIAVRRRLGRDPDGRGAGWIPAYDASSPEVLVA